MVTGSSHAITVPVDGAGVRWQTTCSRELRIFFAEAARQRSAEWADPLELRAERPRAFCLRCLYFAALDALVVTERGLGSFAEAINAGRLPGLVDLP